MFKLDDNFLIELGLGSLPATEKNKMLAHIYETLEMKVGMRLAEKMSNEQLDEFESFINQNDESGALKWLETNFPNYKQVVAEELEKLKSEIKQVAPQIIAQAASTIQPGSPVAAPQPVQAYPQTPAAANAPQQYSQQPQPAPMMQDVPPTPTAMSGQGAYGQPVSAAMPPAQPQVTWQQPTPASQPAYPAPAGDFGPAAQYAAPASAPTSYQQPAGTSSSTPSPYGSDPYAAPMGAGSAMQPSYPPASIPPAASLQPSSYDQNQMQPMGGMASSSMPPTSPYPSQQDQILQPDYYAQAGAPINPMGSPNSNSNSFGATPTGSSDYGAPQQIDFSSPQPLPQHDPNAIASNAPIATQSTGVPGTPPQPTEPYMPPAAEPYQPPR